jgi:methyl-accepting chemotaxis protein
MRRGGIMKKTLFTVMLGILSAVVLCPFYPVQAEKPGNAAARDLLIKSEVETAVSMLEAIYTKHQKGEISLEKAKKLGADLLRDLRYGTDGYFWADTTEGVNVVLYGRKDVEGRNRLEDRDPRGTYYVKEFLSKGKAGGGYVDYWFPKLGQTKAQPKRSYVLLFKPFGWVVGSGYYR